MYLFHSPSLNIFGYSFIYFWTTEYTKYRVFLNIFFEPYSYICLSMFNEQWESGSTLYIKLTSSVKKYWNDSMSEPFSKLIQSVMSIIILIFKWNCPCILFLLVIFHTHEEAECSPVFEFLQLLFPWFHPAEPDCSMKEAWFTGPYRL